jgi:hypothetical protein
MACHLIEEAKQGSLDPKKIEDSIEYGEHLADSDKFDVKICACKRCGQVYIYCFREFNSLKFEDFYWTFWIPAAEKDIAELKKAEMSCKLLADIIFDRAHICWGDKNTVYWSEGNPLAHTIFTLPYMVEYPTDRFLA